MTAWMRKRKRNSKGVAFMQYVHHSEGVTVIEVTDSDDRFAVLSLSVYCCSFVFVDDAGLHDEGDVLEELDVLERVAFDGDDVCPLAGFEEPTRSVQPMRSAALMVPV